MPSFDIVSEVDFQEVDNAVNQASKEVGGRYDFKGSDSGYKWDKKNLSLFADDDYKLSALKDILQSKMHRRGIDIQALKFGEPYKSGGMQLKQDVSIQQGIEKDIAKKIIKAIKDAKLKVQPAIQEDKVRVTSKSIDELQTCIAMVKGESFGLPLQFENMRS